MMETSPSGRPLPLPENPLLRLTPPFRDPISRPPISPQRKDAEMTIATGDKLPQATLVKVTDNGPEQVNAADYFKGRKVAIFSVPGAFTPTCSAKPLPGYVETAAELKDRTSEEQTSELQTLTRT